MKKRKSLGIYRKKKNSINIIKNIYLSDLYFPNKKIINTIIITLN